MNLTALRRGRREIALGGVLGACLMDSSLSLAAGPLLFPTEVTEALVLRGTAVAAATMLVAGLLLALRGRHDRTAGAVLLAVYLSGYLALARIS